MSKAVPEGLKPQECERGSGRVRPPIPYIPEKDDLNDAGESSATIKLTLPTKVDLWVPVWSRGTQEKFLMHVQQAIAAIKAKGLEEAYERLVRAEKECNEKVEEAELNRDITEVEGRDNLALSNAVDKAKEAHTNAKVQYHKSLIKSFNSTPISSWKKQGSHGIKSWQSKSTAVHGRT